MRVPCKPAEFYEWRQQGMHRAAAEGLSALVNRDSVFDTPEVVAGEIPIPQAMAEFDHLLRRHEEGVRDAGWVKRRRLQPA